MSSQRSDWRERLGANPSKMEQELAIKLQDNQIHYLTQVEIPVTTADFYFPLDPRPLLLFVDGRVHLGTAQMIKDEELRTLLRKRGYRISASFEHTLLSYGRLSIRLRILRLLRASSLASRSTAVAK